MKFVVDRLKGERWFPYLERAHKIHVQDWVDEKKSKGQWLSKEDFEKKTGRPGRKG
jgi:hypothetical protein